MRLEVTMTNRNGDEVGKMTMELTTEQVRQKQIEVALTRSCLKYSMRLIVEDGTSPFKHSSGPVEVKVPADNFFYQNTGHIIPSSLNIHTRQSSALLEWNTDNGAIDYFIVRRHDRAKGPDAWETIATNLTNTEYEDKKTAPRHQYDYCVLAANDCEGVDYQSTDTIQGGCKNSGAVEAMYALPMVLVSPISTSTSRQPTALPSTLPLRPTRADSSVKKTCRIGAMTSRETITSHPISTDIAMCA